MPPRQKNQLFTKNGVQYALGRLISPRACITTASATAQLPRGPRNQLLGSRRGILRLTWWVVASGDTALLKSNEELPYVAEIQGIQFDKKGLLHVKCGWYFRPEDLDGGRKPWHGQQELFRSDLTGTSYVLRTRTVPAAVASDRQQPAAPALA